MHTKLTQDGPLKTYGINYENAADGPLYVSTLTTHQLPSEIVQNWLYLCPILVPSNGHTPTTWQTPAHAPHSTAKQPHDHLLPVSTSHASFGLRPPFLVLPFVLVLIVDGSVRCHTRTRTTSNGRRKSVSRTEHNSYDSRERHGMYEAKSESLHELYRACPLPRPGLTPHQQTV